MGPPAWRVSWPGGTACFSRVSSNSAWNRVGIGDAPADDPAAEDVENDVEIEVGPFRRSGQLRDIPRPDLIGAFGEQFGLGVDRVAQLVAALPNLVMVVQDAVQGADRAEGDALVEQGGVGRGQKPRQSFICNRYRCSGRVADWLGSLGYSSFLRGGFHNSLATLPATRKMHAAWSSDWMMKPRRS